MSPGWRTAIVLALTLVVSSSCALGTETCGVEHFRCNNGQCILSTRYCDGITDCSDGSDENNCHVVKCVPPMFLCPGGRCLPPQQLCDGEMDCPDGSDERASCGSEADRNPADEEGETCSSDEFQCIDKTCIKSSWLCDGDPDCLDGSDETAGCMDKFDCSDGFRCKNKHCIIRDFHCDGYDDCGDNSDEESCPTIFHSVDHCPVDQGYFLCADRIACIEGKDVCDGFPHCFDKSDEAECMSNRSLNETYCRSLGCSHSCHMAPHNKINCTCEKGFKLAGDDKTCVDVDECREFGFCHQRCKNLNGSFECSCDDGYILQSDNRTCKASGGDALLLFSSHSRIRGLYLQTQVYFTVAKDLNHVIGVSHNGHHVYWTDISHGEVSIVRATESGHEMEILVDSGLGVPEDLAVDYVTNNIYFTDRRKKHIGVCVETGLLCAVLNNEDIDKPRGIALYPQKGLMYWSDWGRMPMIATSGMDGSNPHPLVYRNLKWPNGLALDISNDRLYWVDAKTLTIETIRLDGSDRQVVLSKSVKHPFSLAIFEDMLYWSDWDSKEIQKCNKFTGKNHTSVLKEKRKSSIFGLHIYHPVLYPRIENPCKDAPCSHMCLLAPTLSYACACPDHSVLRPDMHTCRQTTKPLRVVVGGGNKLFLMSPQHLGRQSTTEINLPDVQAIGCLAYDSLSGSILVSDPLKRKIFRFDMETEEVSVLIGSGLGFVSSMSFDPYGNNLYIADSELKRVDVWSMARNALITVYKTYHGDIPESIVVVPEHGVFFLAVSRANGSIHIIRASMDGSEVLPHIGGERIHGPKISLSYDKRTQRVYWSDSDAEMIESMKIDGTERDVVVPVDGTPISVAAHDGVILWVRRGSSNLYTYDLNETLDHSDHPENILKMAVDKDHYLSLTVVGESRATHYHPCQDAPPSGCSHVCLVSQSDHRMCRCPLGMHLGADNRTCLARAHCTEMQFKCRRDDICIANVQRCDGHADCPSGEDERDCTVNDCTDDQFKCSNGQCISATKRCDSEYDCSDHSDEMSCTSHCTEHNFQCATGECIPITWRCDDVRQCEDGSDEHGCGERECPSTMFTCKMGTCIPGTWECDGDVDCADASDEHEKCVAPTCKPEELTCGNGRCVSHSLACDGIDDCGDGTDESRCIEPHREILCEPDEYLCGVSTRAKCVPRKARCNGTAECPRGEDEMNCSNCQAEEFQCKNGKCISEKWVCDKENDCGDQSDEEPELCPHWIPTRSGPHGWCDDFRCQSGECIPLHLVCNGVGNCRDSSDEGGSCEAACKINSCEQVCIKTPNTGRCACRDGYILNADGYTCTDVDECAEQRCSQICTNTPGSFNCTCLPDYLLKSDMVTCKAIGEPMSYVISGDDQVRKVSHDFKTMEFVFYEPGSQILGIDLDTRRGLLYWSSGINHRINVMKLDGKEKSFIVGAGQPGRLSLDWVTNNTYYIDNTDYGSIRVCHMADKKYADVIHLERGYIISDLAFNPVDGVLYYSKVRPSTLTRPVSEIMRYSASSGNSTVLVGADVSWVSGFAIDYIKQYLYWSDLYHQVVEKIRFDGKDRQIVFKEEVHRPESLMLFEDSLYWLAKGLGSVKKCKLYGDHKGSCQTIPFFVHDIKFMAVLQESRQPNVTNPCRNHCNANSLCILSDTGPRCMCQDGTILPPGKICDAAHMTLSNEITGRMSESHLRQYLTAQDKASLSGNSSVVIGILMTALIICVAFASYLYVKKRKSGVVLETIHFQNPSYDLSLRRSAYHPSELVPGEHQYENPTSKIARHPDGKYVVLAKETESDAKANCGFDFQDYESSSDPEDRIDMKANLIP